MGASFLAAAVAILPLGSTYIAPYSSRLQLPQPRAEIVSRHVAVTMLHMIGILTGMLLERRLRGPERLSRG